ncbi:hypothetical protein [Nocardioides lianchengensis]|uniref:hypothetical protein n=1 Tax=Nocardioides lianchengensis TaxID=1045774 RepID=UPI0017B95EDE|nr:hypothetical protein [Nocardioides lianchengensis]NYG12616.1 hypothetical protein [Nocardioides lianchengensis]
MNRPGVTLWRLTVAASAATGVWLAAQQYDVWWTALSQLANLAVAASYVGLAVREPRSPWLRGGLTSVMLLVALAYLPMANGNLLEPWSLLEHVVTPGLVLADFLLVGANQGGLRWWHPLTWLVAPAAYLVWYVAADLAVYDALDPAASGVFLARLSLLLTLLLAAGFALCLAGRRRVLRLPA